MISHTFTRCLLGITISLTVTAAAAEVKPLPPLKDGSVITGPGTYRQDGELAIQGHVKLSDLDLDLRGPVRLAQGSVLELDSVRITVSDPPTTPNGTSGLHCEGPARIYINHSTMAPAGSAHPIWSIQGELKVNDFQTGNSEFHLDHVQATLDNLRIFELEISRASHVKAHHLRLVFLSTHTGPDDHLTIADIPADKPFSRTLTLGSAAKAELNDIQLQFFLLYVHGQSQVRLARMGRVQLAIFPQCNGTLHLPHGLITSTVLPTPNSSDCPFRIGLNTVNVDTWDVYASGNAKLKIENSLIDELTAGDHADLHVTDSDLYADWLAVSGDAQVNIEQSAVGALRLASERPDLATSQVRLTGRGRARFAQVRFDCGLFAGEQSQVQIDHSTVAPKYVYRSGNAVVLTNGKPGAADLPAWKGN